MSSNSKKSNSYTLNSQTPNCQPSYRLMLDVLSLEALMLRLQGGEEIAIPSLEPTDSY